MAFKKRTRRRHTRAVAAPRRRRTRRAATVGSTYVMGRRRRRSSTAKTATRPRRHKPGFLGATGMQSRFIQIGEMAVGVAIGAAGTHMILRPLEQKLSAHFPIAAKFMGVLEVGLGGFITLWAKSPFVKSIGIGVLAGGVHVVMKQLPIGMHSPAENATMGDYMQPVMIPMNSMAGLVQGGRRDVYTPMVAGIIDNRQGGTVTPWVAGSAILNNTPVTSMGDMDDYDSVFAPKGITVPQVVSI